MLQPKKTFVLNCIELLVMCFCVVEMLIESVSCKRQGLRVSTLTFSTPFRVTHSITWLPFLSGNGRKEGVVRFSEGPNDFFLSWCVFGKNTLFYLGPRLRCCATSRKVAGSIPVGVIGIFH